MRSKRECPLGDRRQLCNPPATYAFAFNLTLDVPVRSLRVGDEICQDSLKSLNAVRYGGSMHLVGVVFGVRFTVEC